jgi:ATP-dependent Clp protease ATP-binding subunit ClpC
MFNLKTAAIFQAVRWGRYFKFAGGLKKLFLILFILTFLFFLYGFLGENFSQNFNSKLLGLSIILLVLTVSLWLKILFFDSKLTEPKLKVKISKAVSQPEEYNLAEFLSYGAAKAVWKSKNNLTCLLYTLLCDNPKLNFVFSRVNLNFSEIKKLLRQYLKKIRTKTEAEPQPEFQKTILESFKIAQKKDHQRVEVGDMVGALAKYDLIFKKILVDNKLKNQDVENLTWWLESLEERAEERKKFWEWKNLIKKGSLAKEWAAGYTITLDRFGIDYSEIMKKKGFPETIGHQKEIKAVERILARREINNCLLVGEPGVGKKSMILALAQKSVVGESLPKVNYKRVVQLDLPSLLAQTESVAEVEAILDTIFQEVISAGNIILVIDEFHNYVGGKERPGVIDVSGILGSYLNLPQFQIVAVTTYSGLHKYIEENPSILTLFERVEVPEISERETLMILENLTLVLEKKYKKFVSFPALREIVSLANRYLPAIPFPKGAMDLLDEVMVYVSSTKEKVVRPEHVAKIVSEKTEIPVGEIKAKEREILLNLEKLIHQRIINQEEAVKEVSTALRRARAEVTVRKGPMGCFLFLGPTGVGKTETAKALAEIYFGSEQRMIRMDMSEFQNVGDIPRLIGSPGEEGLLTTQVRESPFSLILLDEIEKSHANILNLFLQVLDEGFLTDGLGRKVDFKNSIIIATSNAGYQVILEALRQKTEWSEVKQKLLDYLFEKAIFRPEFINRFDAVIIFSPLSKENLLDIAELMLQSLKKNLEKKDVEFIITLPLKEKIVELGYSPVFGAREMRRVIQDKVENILASALLSGKLKRGNRVEIDSEFKLKINP